MQIPIVNGIYTDTNADIRTAYPLNLYVVPKKQGVSNGYLRPSEGLVNFGTGPGVDRGAINWRDVCYRVMGTKLCSISSTGAVTVLGDVGGSGQVTMDYSFDRLAITSSNKLYYWDGAVLTQVTDPDLGDALCVVWVDGYFMTTDGEFLVVTELNDPTQVNPLKYGSSEADPDPVKRILKVRNEIYVLNRNTTEIFQNVGGEGFPFARVSGAQMRRGSIGTYSATVYADSIAFLGSGRNEAICVWVGLNSSAQKVSTREIEQVLATYTTEQLEGVLLESRVFESHEFLYMHLPDRTFVFDINATNALGESVWVELGSSLVGSSKYLARNLVYCYGKWLAGHPESTSHAYLTSTISTHYGQKIGWEFSTTIVYAEGRDAIFHQMELASITGSVVFGVDPTIWTSYSYDGLSWSNERPASAGKSGDTSKRIAWFSNGLLTNYRMQKFRGTSDAHVSVMRLEAQIEGLA